MRCLGGAADKAVEVGAHGDAGLDLHADAVAGHGVDGRAVGLRTGAVDDLGIDAGAHGFQHCFARALDRQIDGASTVEVEFDAGFVRGDEGEHDGIDIAAGQVVRFEFVGVEGKSGFDRRDAAVDDHAHRHTAQAHADEPGEGDRGIGDFGPQPDAEEIEKNDEEDKTDNNGQAGHDVGEESTHGHGCILRRGSGRLQPVFSPHGHAHAVRRHHHDLRALLEEIANRRDINTFSPDAGGAGGTQRGDRLPCFADQRPVLFRGADSGLPGP
jgi:hypothetical protein